MDKAAVEKWMLWTIIGGIAFLACQAWEWGHFITGTQEGGLSIDGAHIFGANSPKISMGQVVLLRSFSLLRGSMAFTYLRVFY